MNTNSSKPNPYQVEDSKKKKDSAQQEYFWVSYPDSPKQDKNKNANQDSLLDRSNRFAL
jgi:hypothetical protein